MSQKGTSDSSAIFQVLADDYARRILVAADRGPMTAKALSEACDASLTTVYRRVSMLQEHDLLEERTSVGPDGTHRRHFETALEELHVDLSKGDLSVTIETRNELADTSTTL